MTPALRHRTVLFAHRFLPRPDHQLVLILVAFPNLINSRCLEQKAGPDCTAEPKGNVVVFLDVAREPMIGHFKGKVVVDSLPNSTSGLQYFGIRDSLGTRYRLGYDGKGEPLPIQVGRQYELEVDHLGRFPAVMGILVSDAKGLLFAAASDLKVGGQVLTSGVPGFDLELLPATCPSRPHGICYDAIYNLPLRVTHRGKSATLVHAASVHLGRYRIICLTAQRVVTSRNCADATQFGISYIITRVAS